MAGEMAGWCGPDRYVDAQGRVHVAVADEGKGLYVCDKCSLRDSGRACSDAKCVPNQREDGKDVHFELASEAADRGPQGTEGVRK